jgi:para-aminobenzoate synthetase component 1
MDGPSLPTHPWIARRWLTASGALVAEAVTGLEPSAVFAAFARLRRPLFLDSAQTDPQPRPQPTSPESPGDAGSAARSGTSVRLGRHSFVAADPVHEIALPAAAPTAAAGGVAALLRTLGRDLACPTIPGLPPFQGGIAGLVSYDYGLATLGLRPPQPRTADVPLVALGVYDVVFAFDHDTGRGWFISQGVPAAGPVARARRATARLTALLEAASAVPSGPESTPATPPVSPAALPPWLSHPLAHHPAVRGSHDPAGYRRMVEAGIDFVQAGDVFQVNLAQQFAVAASVDPIALYLEARRLNAAPFAGYFDAGSVQIASMSPERFLQVTRGFIRMHPIKGTRRIIDSPEADLYAGADLGASAKDRAENVMIVDLVRNDLARVCEPQTVRVEALCRLERYRYVQHLVSIVAGRLRRPAAAWDAFAAAVPGGSVTGAPKHRACEIISALEGAARGAYCGSLGYVGFDGTADFNLLIRTFVISPERISFAAGGGITAASDPAAEHAESLHKAEGMLRVLDAVGLTGSGDRQRTAAETAP